MAIDLKKTDVVIVGLGAVGGVAALPLARAGLDVIGLEAGSWLTPRDFAPDELRNNFRGWPQATQKANTEIPTHRPNASAPYSPRLPIHPMMNGVGGKNSTAVSTIPKAMETKRLQVVTQAIATSVVVDERSGRVTGVNYVKGGQEYFQPADVVLLAGYTYENVRLLLLSKSKPYPNGLANNGGQVGRHR